jgi:hypothetical protein
MDRSPVKGVETETETAERPLERRPTLREKVVCHVRKEISSLRQGHSMPEGDDFFRYFQQESIARANSL